MLSLAPRRESGSSKTLESPDVCDAQDLTGHRIRSLHGLWLIATNELYFDSMLLPLSLKKDRAEMQPAPISHKCHVDIAPDRAVVSTGTSVGRCTTSPPSCRCQRVLLSASSFTARLHTVAGPNSPTDVREEANHRVCRIIPGSAHETCI
ncbi:uncharacterized protein B0I36DRAFT_335086 [Microdochium trichocladiopsis]|uniref:Uncharacterized protein n=1 Tax=Microdochium trichocladiopsis TaxID=1682393 RepID=A0A9P8XTR8_9PEZI|nr:uncharacterized protein B0I36DRAFT_335086 [Microdochium trichocladiopsis]KAH7017962.1 hypothetical protein B0I36DRAFT_335086 [Microdochium trichocladiopsis]